MGLWGAKKCDGIVVCCLRAVDPVPVDGIFVWGGEGGGGGCEGGGGGGGGWGGGGHSRMLAE